MTQNCTIYETSSPRRIWWKACGCQIDEHPQGMCNKQSGPIDILAIAHERMGAALEVARAAQMMNHSPEASKYLRLAMMELDLTMAEHCAAEDLMMELRA